MAALVAAILLSEVKEAWMPGPGPGTNDVYSRAPLR
jgi:hypothetical protein